MLRSVILRFDGPLSWCASSPEASIFQAPGAQDHGIYVWTAPTRRGEVVLYVGATGRTFSSRMQEHLIHQLAGLYDIHDPAALRSGKSDLLWGGMMGAERERSLRDYVRRLPRLAPDLTRFIRAVRFYVAPLNAEPRRRERIEAAIAMHLRNQKGTPADFQDSGVRYRPRWPRERPFQVRCKWPRPLVGAPRTLYA